MLLIRLVVLQIMFISAFYLRCSNASPRSRWNMERSLPFMDCGSTYDLVSVLVSSCDQSPCKVPLGNVIQLTADFITDELNTNRTMVHEAYWILNSVQTPATISPRSCDGKFCPFKSVDGLGFSAELMVNQTLPAIRGTLYWRVINNYEKLVICFKLPISISL